MMTTTLSAIGIVGWAIALFLGIQNYNLRKEVEALKLQQERRARENKIRHEMLESVLHGLGKIIAETQSVTNAKARVDEIWKRAEAQAAEELRNEERNYP